MAKAKKIKQIPTRFTEQAVAGIDRIAEVEERDRAEIIRFFVDWGLIQYDIAGSLAVLKPLRVSSGTKALVPSSHISNSILNDTVKALLAEERITGEEAEALLGKPKEKTVQKHSRSKTS